VSQGNDDHLDFDDLNLSGDDLAMEEPAAGEVASEEAAPAEPLTPPEEPVVADEPAGKSPGASLPYVEWCIAAAVAVVILGLGWRGIMYLSTALFIVSIGLVCYALWRCRQSSGIETVLLGCALVAVLTALYCLWLEMGRYGFDIKARDSKQRVSAVESPRHAERLV